LGTNNRQQISLKDIRREALGETVDVEQTRELFDRMSVAGWIHVWLRQRAARGAGQAFSPPSGTRPAGGGAFHTKNACSQRGFVTPEPALAHSAFINIKFIRIVWGPLANAIENNFFFDCCFDERKAK
jgi:hypothetical protein